MILTIKLISNIAIFLFENIEHKYDTIIANPPYFKSEKTNIYLQFIDKCLDLLSQIGEMIFIVPADFIKITSARNVINKMFKNGSFTHIYQSAQENLFKNASISVIIFRYQFGYFNNNQIYFNNELVKIRNNNGMIILIDDEEKLKVGDYFDVYVGMVSGADLIFNNDQYGNVELITGKNKRKKFILIDNFPTTNTGLNTYLLNNKEKLMNRRIRKFNDNNWYQWGALRNYNKIQSHRGQRCIYIHNLTRMSEVAFVGQVDYFSGNLLIMIPKKDINLLDCVEYFNNQNFKSYFTYSGRFKIGQRQLVDSYFKISHSG